MKKIMLILVVLVQTTLFAQGKQTKEKPLKLASVADGTLSDDVLLIGATDQVVKKITVNNLLISKANINSPIFTGTPTLPSGTIATTQTAGNNTTAIATTAFVTTADNLKANLASPTFTGTPTLPTGTIATTQTAGNNTAAIATTAFVTTAGNLKANLASPTFTGTPTLPTGTIATTQTAGNNTTAIATTAFVTTADNLKANLVSPIFTGTPTLPTGTIATTQTIGNYTTAVATTAFVLNQIPNFSGNWTPTVTLPINCTIVSIDSGTFIVGNSRFASISFSVTVTVISANTLTSIRVNDPSSYSGLANSLVGFGFAYLSDTNIVPVMYRSTVGNTPTVSFYPTASGTYKLAVSASYRIN
jgi:hypothetical protein